MMGYRDRFYFAYAAVLLLIIGATVALSPSPPRRLAAGAIAPEVCEHDGPVRYGLVSGSLLYVHCADGMVKLVQR